NGVTAYDISQVSVPPPSVAIAPQATNRAIIGQTVTMTALGYPAVSYQWQSNGVDIAGAIGPILTLANITTNFTATYTCVIANSAGTTNVSQQLTVVGIADLVHLSLLWRVGPLDSKPWLDGTGAGTPNQRDIA